MFPMFTYAQAIARLVSGPKSAFVAGLTPGQQLQRINEVLERFYELGTWAGVLSTLSGLTTTNGVITLPNTYLRLDALSNTNGGMPVPIKNRDYLFNPAGPGLSILQSTGGSGVAIDQGDVNGQRQYQITGDPAILDTLTFTGLARLRYIWATSTSALVIPDCYQALRRGVIALGWEDEGDLSRYDAVFTRALTVLNGNYSQSESDTEHGVVACEPATSMGMIPNLN